MEIIGLVMYVCVFAFVALYRLEYGVLVILATAAPAYLIRFSLGPLPTTLLEIQLLLLCGIAIVRHREELWHALVPRGAFEKALAVSIAAFIISASISVAVSPDIRAALGIWRAYFIEPVLFFAIILAVFKTPIQIGKAIGALGISAALVALVALAQVFAGFPIPPPWQAELRATGIYPYPNAVGLFIAPIIPLILACAITRNGLFRYAALCVCALLIGGIIAAKTVGALVALAAAGLIGGLCWNKASRQWCMRILVIGALIGIVVPSIYTPIQKKLFFHEWSGTVRQIIWKETMPMIRDHWLTGAGLAGYQKTFEPYHKERAIEIFLYPHTIVLNFWSEIGLYGLMSAIALVSIYFILLIRSRNRADRALCFGLAGAMITILVHGIVDVPYFKNDLALVWWTLFAFACVLYRHYSLRHEKEF